MALSNPKGKTTNKAGKAIANGLIFLKHRRLICLLTLLALSTGLTLFVYSKPLYYAKAKVHFRILDLPIHADTTLGFSPVYHLQRTMIADLRARNLIERTAMRIGLVNSTGQYAFIAQNFVPSVNVNVFDSSVLFVEVQAYSADLAMSWTEAMLKEYKDYKAEQRIRMRSENAASYLKEMEGVLEKLKSAQEAKFEFEKRTDFTTVAFDYMELSNAMSDLYVVENQIKAAERAKNYFSKRNLTALEKLARIDLYRREVSKISSPNISRERQGASPVTVVDPMLNQKVVIAPGTVDKPNKWDDLRSKHDEIVHKRSVALASGLGLEHEEIMEYNRQISLVDKEIESEVGNQMSVFENEYSLLFEKQKDLEDMKPRFEDVSKVHSRNKDEYERLDTGSMVWEKAHKDLKAKVEALEFGGDKERIELQYEGIDRFKETPISPNKIKLLMMSLMLAVGLGVGVPVALEHLNDTASKIEEIENALNLPGLGIVPVTGTNELEDIVRSPEIDARIPNSLLENFRVIRSGIALNKELDSQVVMVTSSRPSEGKTVNSCNLGWAFASLKEPTLIIDSDLRRGRVHRVLDIPNEKGLSNFAMGQASLEEVVQQTKVPNLYAITRGPIIPGSTECLCTPEYEAKIIDLRTRFDRIVMDTPPVLGLSETASLMRLVDGVVLIIRAERTSQRDILAAVTLLRKAGAKFFGFVLNRLDLDRIANYYNYYYYSAYYYEDMVDDENEDDRPPRSRPPRERPPREVVISQRPRGKNPVRHNVVDDQQEKSSW
jgi:succinoglycan biosynthesis transport protein ExoP